MKQLQHRRSGCRGSGAAILALALIASSAASAEPGALRRVAMQPPAESGAWPIGDDDILIPSPDIFMFDLLGLQQICACRDPAVGVQDEWRNNMLVRRYRNPVDAMAARKE
jgi:hypothetical protein